MLDEARIQFSLYSELLARGHEIILPNVSWSWLNWEADLISITKARYLNEFEIKISLSDFKKDFDKRKHNYFRHSNSHRMPNYFWYVAPIEAIPICIPDYAGLIEIWEGERDGRIWLKEIKRPTKIHGRKLESLDVYSMLRTIMFKYWNLAKIGDRYKKQRDLFREF